ncbi:MAG: InlB B-repeat-containing protein [Treponema sp.]|uniref:hypothetical protein n=1 Tax=Treponema sp. TaxID=166 RepID=UPI0025FC8EBF|nr:hypothetical protein [Treponema sp.]MBQ8681216.1 InlB B-repeat-containing protein [Treponema sp.]MBR1403118.1 InlB B-repeat-containing protein [Treponema sp.]
MKKLFKTLAALAVVAALGFGFVSCGGGNDDSSSGGGNPGNSGGGNNDTNSALAIFSCDAGYDQRTLTFFADSTFKVIVSDETGSQAEGTYTFDSGDWENGTITLTATSGYKQDTFTGTKTITGKQITFSTKTYTLTGGTLKTPAKENENNNSGNSDTTNTDTTKTDSTETDTTKTDTPATTSSAIFKTFDDYEISFATDSTYLINCRGDFCWKGTYTLEGDFNNGTVTMKQTHSWIYGKWEESTYTDSFKIENGVGTYGRNDVSYNVLTALAVYEYSGSSKELVIFSEDSTFKLLEYGECETDGKYKLDSGDWENGTIILFDKKPYKKSGIYTISEKKLDLGLTYSLKDGTLKTPTSSETDSSVAFSGTDDLYGKKYLFKFSNGNYVQWVDGKESEKGTYTMAGDFTNGFMKLIKTHQYANDSWETTEENIIKCEIRDGTLSLGRVEYETVSYDYDVTDDLPKARVYFWTASTTKRLLNNSNDSYTEIKVKKGTTLEKPTAPTLNDEDYEFVGWYTCEGRDENYTEILKPFDFDTPITEDRLELYAKWTTSIKAEYNTEDSNSSNSIVSVRFYTDNTYKLTKKPSDSTGETNIEEGTYEIEISYGDNAWKHGAITFTPYEGDSYEGTTNNWNYGIEHCVLDIVENGSNHSQELEADYRWFWDNHPYWSNEN